MSTQDISPVSSNTLLDYSLSTTPEPLEVSPSSSDLRFATLTFVISNGGSEVVNVSSLQLTLPVGTTAQSLTSDAFSILTQQQPLGLWNVTTPAPGVFLFVPQSGNPVPVSTAGLLIQLYNIPVNLQVGTVALNVSETASSTGITSMARNAIFEVAKFPAGFSFGDFAPETPAIEEGETATLTWTGTENASYKILFEDQEVDVTNVRTWTSPALTDDTTFVLRAQVVVGVDTAIHKLTTTVIVNDPTIVASTLEVTGESTFKGDIRVDDANPGGSTAQLIVAVNPNRSTAMLGNTDVRGTLNIGTFTSQAGGALFVGGKTELALAPAFWASNTLTVTGPTGFNGSATFNGSISALDTAITLADPMPEGSRSYRPTTDGFVIGTLSPNGHLCWAEIVATSFAPDDQTAVLRISANGGTVDIPPSISFPLAQSLCLPAPNGRKFTIELKQILLNPAHCKFYFVPIGKGIVNRL